MIRSRLRLLVPEPDVSDAWIGKEKAIMPGAHCSKYSQKVRAGRWAGTLPWKAFISPGKEPRVYSEDSWRALKGLEQGSDTLRLAPWQVTLAARGDSRVNGLISALEMAVVQTQIAAVEKDSWGQMWKELRKNQRGLLIDWQEWETVRLTPGFLM